MKNLLLLALALLIPVLAFCQIPETAPTYNFDFELVQDGKPALWDSMGSEGYVISVDATAPRSGKYAGTIAATDEAGSFRAFSFKLPHNYKGRKIKLSGYIKTENVTGGWAGLWMRLDPNAGFDNMQRRGIKGTTDWKRYEVTLNLNPAVTKQIYIGALLSGKGKMWVDDLKVTIDGKDIQNLKPKEETIFPAMKDRSFDYGSRIRAIAIDDKNIADLKTLGLVWGFLKYYHPVVAKGNYNWDYELFRILPDYTAAATPAARDAVLLAWVQKLGKVAPGKKSKTTDIKFGPDLAWIETSGFSKELTASLQAVRQAKRPGEHYYIGLVPSVANPIFKNEAAYASMLYPDAGLRLLALYRYWNMIQYYFPYKNLIEEDWKDVLEEFVPKFINAPDETAYILATVELIARIHDTHANVWGGNRALEKYFGLNYAAVKLGFIQNQAVVTGYHHPELGKATGLEIGDIITKINGRPVETIVQERLKYTPASNFPTQERNIAPRLLRTNDSTITVEFSRAGTTGRKNLGAYPYRKLQVNTPAPEDSSFRMIDQDIAYINNGSIKLKQLPEVWKQLQHTKGLVIDNRNYPSDFVIYKLGGYLMPERKNFVKFTHGSITEPGLFYFNKTIPVGQKNPNYYKAKVVILVNETTQSSAEYHAMAYQAAPNATVIGSTTAAADGNVSNIMLPGGLRTMISGIGVHYPDGTETQRIGIVPDIEVKPSIEGIKAGRDEVLEKAIEVIKKHIDADPKAGL